MYTLEGVSSVANVILLKKSLNKTKTTIFKSAVCSLFPKAIFFTLFYYTIAGVSAVWRR